MSTPVSINLSTDSAHMIDRERTMPFPRCQKNHCISVWNDEFISFGYGGHSCLYMVAETLYLIGPRLDLAVMTDKSELVK